MDALRSFTEGWIRHLEPALQGGLLALGRYLPHRITAVGLLAVLWLTGCASSGESGASIDDLLARIDGQLDQAVPEMTDCFQRELGPRAQTLNGRIIVQFEIGEDGLVDKLSVLESELGAAEADECVSITISRQYFPDWEGRRPVRLTKPFQFVAGQ